MCWGLCLRYGRGGGQLVLGRVSVGVVVVYILVVRGVLVVVSVVARDSRCG